MSLLALAFSIALNLTCKNIILGSYENPHYAINNCILQGKYYIHKQKCNTSPIFFDRFKVILKRHILLEKAVLLKNKKEIQFNDRWGTLLNIL